MMGRWIAISGAIVGGLVLAIVLIPDLVPGPLTACSPTITTDSSKQNRLGLGAGLGCGRGCYLGILAGEGVRVPGSAPRPRERST